jgi:hypothetical protein
VFIAPVEQQETVQQAARKTPKKEDGEDSINPCNRPGSFTHISFSGRMIPFAGLGGNIGAIWGNGTFTIFLQAEGLVGIDFGSGINGGRFVGTVNNFMGWGSEFNVSFAPFSFSTFSPADGNFIGRGFSMGVASEFGVSTGASFTKPLIGTCTNY